MSERAAQTVHALCIFVIAIAWIVALCPWVAEVARVWAIIVVLVGVASLSLLRMLWRGP